MNSSNKLSDVKREVVELDQEDREEIRELLKVEKAVRKYSDGNGSENEVLEDLEKRISISEEESRELAKEIEKNHRFGIEGYVFVRNAVKTSVIELDDPSKERIAENIQIEGQGFSVGCEGCEWWEEEKSYPVGGIALHRGKHEGFLTTGEDNYKHDNDQYSPTELMESMGTYSCLCRCPNPENAAELIDILQKYS